MPSPTYSIVIPCFNEGVSLESVVTDIISTFDASEFAGDYELIVVDDGSSDNSWDVIETLTSTHPHVHGVRRKANGGMWRAIPSGFAKISGQFMSYLPADGEITATESLKLMRLSSEADIVISERISTDNNVKKSVRPWYREFLSWGQRSLTRILLGCDISKAEGIFLIRWSVFSPYATAPRDDNVLFLELLARGLTGQYRVAATTMNYTLRRSGRTKTVNLPHILGTFFDLIRLRYRLLKQR